MTLLKRPFGKARSAAVPRPVATAERVRYGLTGLAAIFLLVLAVAAGIKPAQSLANADSQGEPLAVLGVAPGSGPALPAQDRQPPVPAPRPSRT